MQLEFQQERQSESFPNYKKRQLWLSSLKRAILENEDKIINAIDQDFNGRARFESEIAEIYPAIKAIRHAQKDLSSWLGPEKRAVSLWFQPAKAKIIYQPLGVVGIVVPWNYPLYMAVGPLVAALAAGNRVMLKMSEFAPSFGQLFAALMEQYLPDAVKVINGGSEVGEKFSKLAFDHLLFTGSNRVGKLVMKAASENLTPVTLELSGKSPTIIDQNFSVKTAAERIMFGKLLNAGQTCLAPDYIFVHESKQEELVEACKTAAQTFHPQWDNEDYTSINSPKQFERKQALLQDAIDKGAEIVWLHPEQESVGASQRLAPALILQTSADMRVRQEELFGPFLPILSYQELDEVIDYVNANPRPLALYFFSNNKKNINRILTETISGGVTLNDVIMHVSQETLPFGGVGGSGFGQYHGQEGFKTFSKAKSIFSQSRFAGSRLMYPPYSSFAKKLYRLMRGYR